MGNNYDFNLNDGMVSIVNYNLQLLFQAMEHVNFDINKSLMMMDEIEMQQLGHCFFAAFEPTGEFKIETNGDTGETIEAQNQATQDNDKVPF